MNLINKPITGSEILNETTSPYSALVNFYTAFNNQDFALMKNNWLQTNEASMSNPLGEIKREWKNIKEIYKKIFNGNSHVYVEFYNYTIHTTKDMFIAIGHERGSLEINNSKVDLAIRTSRVYKLHKNQWKQIHHHGSIDNPALLNTYQLALLNY